MMTLTLPVSGKRLASAIEEQAVDVELDRAAARRVDLQPTLEPDAAKSDGLGTTTLDHSVGGSCHRR